MENVACVGVDVGERDDALDDEDDDNMAKLFEVDANEDDAEEEYDVEDELEDIEELLTCEF